MVDTCCLGLDVSLFDGESRILRRYYLLLNTNVSSVYSRGLIEVCPICFTQNKLRNKKRR